MRKKIEVTGPNGTFEGSVQILDMQITGFYKELLLAKKNVEKEPERFLDVVEYVEGIVRSHLRVLATQRNPTTDNENELVKRGYV